MGKVSDALAQQLTNLDDAARAEAVKLLGATAVTNVEAFTKATVWGVIIAALAVGWIVGHFFI